jgi:hypothetical protein
MDAPALSEVGLPKLASQKATPLHRHEQDI